MSDYLTDEEQVAKLKSWWDENGVSVIVTLVLVVAGVVGWRWYESYHETRVARVSDLYEEFLVSEGDARDASAASIAEEAPDSAYQTLVMLRRSQESMESGDYEAAEAFLVEAVEAAPEPVLADVARVRLARVQQQLDRLDDALETLSGVLGEGYRSQVAEMKGDIHLARGERALAYEAYASALAAVGDNQSRPVLEMKAADTADAVTGAQPAAAPEAGQGLESPGETAETPDA
ncbi:MAG TPA: tetratricopeptide repeat protein [Pseudomonadales bacterium]